MKQLTLRGIRLRSQIEAMTPAPLVIESYPGAAQDILCLPRKQKSLGLLREGLRELGLAGPGLEARSHDEIDAITSAVVGRFYESGDFEPMGVPQEAQLIVPKQELFSYDHPPIICLSGKTAAGKSVIARYLAVFYGFEWCKTRDLIRELLLEDASLPAGERQFDRQVSRETVTEKDLQDFGALILQDHGQAPLRRKLRDVIDNTTTALVVDAIRDLSDLGDAPTGGRPVFIWYVDCVDSIIEARLSARVKDNSRNSAGKSPVDVTSDSLRCKADRIIPNLGTLEELRWKVDDEFFSLVAIS
jgi:dephospho-CoA kinase